MNDQLSPQEQITRRINEIYSVYGTFFYSGFHTCLWHILFSKATEGKTVTFYQTQTILIVGAQMSLVLADSTGGYIPTPAIFKKEETFDSALSICVCLSKEVFNQTPEEHQKIADNSFVNSGIVKRIRAESKES